MASLGSREESCSIIILFITFIDGPWEVGLGTEHTKTRTCPQKGSILRRQDRKIQNGLSWGWPTLTFTGPEVSGLPCPRVLSMSGAHNSPRAMMSLTLQLGPDYLAPRQWAPGLGER